MSVDQVIAQGGWMRMPDDATVFASVNANDSDAAAAAAAVSERTGLPAAGVLVCAALVATKGDNDEGVVDVLEWVADHGDEVAELARSTVEQGRALELITHAYDRRCAYHSFAI
jgi:hypothetical protein